MANAFKVGGITPFSASDYPGKLAAVIFVQGCPWRCGYCHNPHLQPRLPHSPVAWGDVLNLLERRHGLLDAVVFSGGEPTMDRDLEHALRDVRAMGFDTGLHTGGAYPRRLESVLPLLDWVGFDVKALPSGYDAITQRRGSHFAAWQSLQLLLDSGIDYECRTTVHSTLLSDKAISELAGMLAKMGVHTYALQAFRTEGCSDESLNSTASGHRFSESLLQTLRPLFRHLVVRQD